jgi:hypothetical protein
VETYFRKRVLAARIPNNLHNNQHDAEKHQLRTINNRSHVPPTASTILPFLANGSDFTRALAICLDSGLPDPTLCAGTGRAYERNNT